jgi:DNA-binding NarL/FixJ family response regulator
MEHQIRVVIADEHRLIRDGIRMMLRDEKGIEIVGEAANGLQAINAVDDLKPDVVLLDVSMPEIDGIQAIVPIRQKSPNTKAIVLTGAIDDDVIFKSLKAGAKGYLSKNSSASDLSKAIRAVHRGELWVERKLMSRFFDQEAVADSQGKGPHTRSQDGLTPREHEVLSLLTTGYTNKEIGQDLFISEKTVKCHVNNIFRKLHVTRRLEAILYPIGKGLS